MRNVKPRNYRKRDAVRVSPKVHGSDAGFFTLCGCKCTSYDKVTDPVNCRNCLSVLDRRDFQEVLLPRGKETVGGLR